MGLGASDEGALAFGIDELYTFTEVVRAEDVERAALLRRLRALESSFGKQALRQVEYEKRLLNRLLHQAPLVFE